MAEVTSSKKDPVLEALKQRGRRVHELTNTSEGRELIEALREQFFTDLKGKDEHETTFKAGRADVVAWLMAWQKKKFTE